MINWEGTRMITDYENCYRWQMEIEHIHFPNKFHLNLNTYRL